MGSRGRRSATYVKVRNIYQQGATCWVCGVYGRMTVDHVPALHTAPTPEQWVGTYRPACLTCQRREGAAITNGHTRPRSRTW